MQDQANTVKDRVDTVVTQIVNGLPEFLGALVILLIGYIVAKVLAATVRKTLRAMQLDTRLHAGKGGNVIERAIPSPTRLASRLTFWVVFLFSISIAVAVLGIPVLVDMVRAIYAYIPNVIAAVLIFLVASAISAGIVTLVNNAMGDTPTGKVMASVGPIIVMGLAVFMILNQLRIAPEIVTITYAALVGSAGLGAALAFGLGGRDVAARMLQGVYDASQQYKQTAAADLSKGVQKVKRRARR